MEGFDTRLIDMNRTCKVTKGGQVVKYTAMVACGNYNGVIGFAKAKGPAVPVALQKKSFTISLPICSLAMFDVQLHRCICGSWHYNRHEGWRNKKSILHLAGLMNVKSKVIGSRNPHNTVKAVFKALNAIETPRDVQEKFGRTVVEKYLL
ncbi:hypothetical protein Fmac_019122 [Flemingia macrophylla]|uniref:S5 DRBM domain-containing protein n=1 Tax=Flemingia macrophylla TaxID=520843 RepID=A0ABD1M6Z4_9FABA